MKMRTWLSDTDMLLCGRRCLYGWALFGMMEGTALRDAKVFERAIIFIELVTSDRENKASREDSK